MIKHPFIATNDHFIVTGFVNVFNLSVDFLSLHVPDQRPITASPNPHDSINDTSCKQIVACCTPMQSFNCRVFVSVIITRQHFQISNVFQIRYHRAV